MKVGSSAPAGMAGALKGRVGKPRSQGLTWCGRRLRAGRLRPAMRHFSRDSGGAHGLSLHTITPHHRHERAMHGRHSLFLIALQHKGLSLAHRTP